MPQVLPDLRSSAGVLFDLDGVLTPTAEVHMRAWQSVFDAVFAQWGITPSYTDADYYEYVDGKPRYEGVRDFLASRGVTVPEGTPTDAPALETVCGLGNRKNDVFNTIIQRDGVTPYPGSVALLDTDTWLWSEPPRQPPEKLKYIRF